MMIFKLLSVPCLVSLVVCVLIYNWVEMDLNDPQHILTLIALASGVAYLTILFWRDFLLGGTPIKVGDDYLILGSEKADKTEKNGPIVEELSRGWQDKYSKQRDIHFEVCTNFLTRLSDGRAYTAPREELEAEFERIVSIYKNSDQKSRQALALIEGPYRQLTKIERREYFKHQNAVEKADLDAQPEKRARRKLNMRIYRARQNLEAANDEAIQQDRQSQLDAITEELDEFWKIGGVFTRKANEAKKAFEDYQIELLNKWIPPESVGFDEIFDMPMPDPVPPEHGA